MFPRKKVLPHSSPPSNPLQTVVALSSIPSFPLLFSVKKFFPLTAIFARFFPLFFTLACIEYSVYVKKFFLKLKKESGEKKKKMMTNCWKKHGIILNLILCGYQLETCWTTREPNNDKGLKDYWRNKKTGSRLDPAWKLNWFYGWKLMEHILFPAIFPYSSFRSEYRLFNSGYQLFNRGTDFFTGR